MICTVSGLIAILVGSNGRKAHRPGEEDASAVVAMLSVTQCRAASPEKDGFTAVPKKPEKPVW